MMKTPRLIVNSAPARRRFVIGLVAVLLCAIPLFSKAQSEQAAWQALQGGAILLMRHALAPGTGDPSEFTLGDCTTQRNLNETGRAQARQWGERLRSRNVQVGAVWSSGWCRTLETARLLDTGHVVEQSAFNSFFQDFSRRAEQTDSALHRLRSWQGPGTLVVVSHMVNISALVSRGLGSGDGIVVEFKDDALRIIGVIPAP